MFRVTTPVSRSTRLTTCADAPDNRVLSKSKNAACVTRADYAQQSPNGRGVPEMGKTPQGVRGLSTETRWWGDHLVGSFGRPMGGIAGAIYVDVIMHVNA